MIQGVGCQGPPLFLSAKRNLRMLCCLVALESPRCVARRGISATRAADVLRAVSVYGSRASRAYFGGCHLEHAQEGVCTQAAMAGQLASAAMSLVQLANAYAMPEPGIGSQRDGGVKEPKQENDVARKCQRCRTASPLVLRMGCWTSARGWAMRPSPYTPNTWAITT